MQVNEDLVNVDNVYVRYRLDGSLFNLSYRAFQLTPRLMRGLSETFSSQMMLTRLPTQNQPCNVSLPASQMLPSFFASRSAWRRRRSFTSLPPEKNTTRLTSLSAKPSWSQCSSSLTLVVPSHLMPGLTRKSTAKASSAFGRLYKRVWNNNNMKTQTKISVYWAVILTTLLHGSEAWVTYRSHVRLLQRFHQRCLRTILNIH